MLLFMIHFCSGESGAGKTEATKQALNYLAYIAGNASGMQEKILRASPVLEAWCNAKTLRNNNSSRFGKYMEIWFDQHGMIVGSSSTTYLLEKSRVVAQLEQERNYHAFYHLLSGADRATLERYHLIQPTEEVRMSAQLMNKFRLLNRSGCTVIEDVDDAADHAVVLSALSEMGFPAQEIDSLYQTLAGILLLGNVSFGQAEDDTAHINDGDESKDYLARCCAALGLEYTILQKVLLSREVRSGGKRNSTYFAKYNAITAADTADALAKEIYRRSFDFIVSRINALMYDNRVRATSMIGVLDIFGFEIFRTNSFEQLCINLANEALQQHFNFFSKKAAVHVVVSFMSRLL